MSTTIEVQSMKDANCNLKNQQQEEIQIVSVLEKDTDEVIKLLKTFFYKDEPLNNYIKLGASVELDEYTKKALANNCSFKALNSHGEIIGVLVNSTTNRPKPNDPIQSQTADCKDPKFKKILALLDDLDDHFSTFDMYPDIDKYLDAAILSVDVNYRGYGIAGKLMEKSLQYARENKISVVKVICTSFFSAKVCEKIGFEKVYTLKYADYKVDGINVFLPEKPHEAVQVLVHEIN